MGRTKKKPPASVPDNDTVREEQEVTKKQCTQETPVKMKKNGGGMVTNEGMTEPGCHGSRSSPDGTQDTRLNNLLRKGIFVTVALNCYSEVYFAD